MKFNSDVDIDLGYREKLLDVIPHAAAQIKDERGVRRHNTGVYVTPIPYNPVTDTASMDYREAEQRGYFKLDLLNVFVYKYVRDEDHLKHLMREPNWDMLKKKSVVQKLIHLGKHYYGIERMPEPIDSIPRLAMFLAVIRPAKKHLLGETWAEVAKTIWDKSADEEYAFKKSHAIAYAQLVVVHMNLLSEGVDTTQDVLPE